MSLKNDEGAVFSPMPMLEGASLREKRPALPSREPKEPLCEMCGHTVIATHCKRICVRCGFMTGCSEGI